MAGLEGQLRLSNCPASGGPGQSKTGSLAKRRYGHAFLAGAPPREGGRQRQGRAFLGGSARSAKRRQRVCSPLEGAVPSQTAGRVQAKGGSPEPGTGPAHRSCARSQALARIWGFMVSQHLQTEPQLKITSEERATTTTLLCKLRGAWREKWAPARLSQENTGVGHSGLRTPRSTPTGEVLLAVGPGVCCQKAQYRPLRDECSRQTPPRLGYPKDNGAELCLCGL